MDSANQSGTRSSTGLLRGFLRFFFHHFYHGFAWSYDAVAAAVSIGRWNDWVACSIPFIRGTRVLEIGHGPGHLQVRLHKGGYRYVLGLDESPHMGRLAKSRLERAGHSLPALARGIAQQMPFASDSFDTIVSTFPAEYIFEAETMQEVRRVLAAGGRFVVLPAAWIVGRKALDKAAAWLFRATHQAPPFPAAVMADRLRGNLEQAGFRPEFEIITVRSSEVLIVVADF